MRGGAYNWRSQTRSMVLWKGVGMETVSRQPWRQRQRERGGTKGKNEWNLSTWSVGWGLCRWCQNSVLRACGQTKIKGAGATEWHSTHMHAYTRLNGLSQIGFIMSQPLGLSKPPIMQCDWTSSTHSSSSEEGSEKKKRGEFREVKKASGTLLCSFHCCQRHIQELPSSSHSFFEASS